MGFDVREVLVAVAVSTFVVIIVHYLLPHCISIVVSSDAVADSTDSGASGGDADAAASIGDPDEEVERRQARLSGDDW